MTHNRAPECVECGGIRAKTLRTGWTTDDQRIRERKCLDCGHKAVSVEVYIPDGMTTFWRLNPDLIERDRANRYRRIGKGVYRLPNRRTSPDRLGIAIEVNKGGKAPATHCNRGHELTPSNIYQAPSGGYRSCRLCRDRRYQERKARNAA